MIVSAAERQALVTRWTVDSLAELPLPFAKTPPTNRWPVLLVPLVMVWVALARSCLRFVAAAASSASTCLVGEGEIGSFVQSVFTSSPPDTKTWELHPKVNERPSVRSPCVMSNEHGAVELGGREIWNSMLTRRPIEWLDWIAIGIIACV